MSNAFQLKLSHSEEKLGSDAKPWKEGGKWQATFRRKPFVGARSEFCIRPDSTFGSFFAFSDSLLRTSPEHLRNSPEHVRTRSSR